MIIELLMFLLLFQDSKAGNINDSINSFEESCITDGGKFLDDNWKRICIPNKFRGILPFRPTKDKKSDWRKDLGVKCQVQMRIIPAVAQASEKGSEPLVQSVEALDNEIQCGSLLSLPHLSQNTHLSSRRQSGHIGMATMPWSLLVASCDKVTKPDAVTKDTRLLGKINFSILIHYIY